MSNNRSYASMSQILSSSDGGDKTGPNTADSSMMKMHLPLDGILLSAPTKMNYTQNNTDQSFRNETLSDNGSGQDHD